MSWCRRFARAWPEGDSHRCPSSPHPRARCHGWANGGAGGHSRAIGGDDERVAALAAVIAGQQRQVDVDERRGRARRCDRQLGCGRGIGPQSRFAVTGNLGRQARPVGSGRGDREQRVGGRRQRGEQRALASCGARARRARERIAGGSVRTLIQESRLASTSTHRRRLDRRAARVGPAMKRRARD